MTSIVWKYISTIQQYVVHFAMKGSTEKITVVCFSPKATKIFNDCIEKICDEFEYLEKSSNFGQSLRKLFCVVKGSCETTGEMVKILKSINQDLTKNDELSSHTDLLKLLCELYLFCCVKYPYKALFSRLLQNSIWKESNVAFELHEMLVEVLECRHAVDLPEPHVIQTLEHIFQNFFPNISSPILQRGLQYVANVLKLHRNDFEECGKTVGENLAQCIRNLCNDIKCATVLIQQEHRSQFISQPNGAQDENSTLIQTLLNEISFCLKQDNLGWECWNAAGFLHCLLVKKRFGMNPIFLLEEMLKLNGNENEELCDGVNIGLCNGCLVYLNTNILKRNGCSGPKSEPNSLSNGISEDSTRTSKDIMAFIDRIFNQLMALTKRVKCVPDQVALAKCVVQWTATLKNFVKLDRKYDSESVFHQLKTIQFYATAALDHPVDVIRHQAKDIMVNLLTICGSNDSSKELVCFSRQLISNAFAWDWHKRPVYIFLLCSAAFVDIDFILNQDLNLIEKMLVACVSQSLAPYASQLYLQYAQMYGDQYPKSNQNVISDHAFMDYWLRPALSYLLNCNVHQSRLLVDYTIVKLLKLYGAPSVNYLVSCLKEEDQRIHKEKSNFLSCLILCLKPAQRLGLMQKTLAKTSDNENVSNFNKDVIKSALVHQDNQVRLDAFCLFCESWKPTALIANADLNLIKYALPYNMTCQCPAFRQQLLNTIQKFLHRMSLNLESLHKGKHGSKAECQAFIDQYTDFEHWLVAFSFDNLFQGASYPRKNLALKILSYLVTCQTNSRKDFAKLTKLLTSQRIELLTDLLKDCFEDNKQLALDILTQEKLKSHVKRALGSSFLWDLVETSLKAGRYSCKPEVCRDAAFNLRFAAKINQSEDKNIITMCKYFVSSLRDDVKVASRNLLKAVQSGPMHGCLLCLRMLLTDANTKSPSYVPSYRKLLLDCTHLCYKIASAVFPVVGSESPEGYIPEVAPEMKLPDVFKQKYEKIRSVLKEQIHSGRDHSSEETYRISGQRMLVMCWRSAKESYLLLQLISSLASKHGFDDENNALLSWNQFLKIGEHLRSQLMDTVHRGTFEVAYAAFREYCPLLWRSKTSCLNSRPKQWIEETVRDICDPEKARKLCSTRRSAGLPFFLQALLGSEKSQVTRDCLCHVMDSLLPLVTCDVIVNLEEPNDCSQQIHSLNVLRGLIKDASLAEDVMPYLSTCVQTAIIGFGSSIWRIRNSSTLLFSALMTRIFGVKKEKDLETSGKNRLSSHEFFTRMPELQDFLLEHLRKNMDQSEANSIEKDANLYPVLLLLSRVYPSPTRQQGFTEPLAIFLPFLVRCGFSPIYKCRVMAANAVASVTASEDISKMLSHLLQTLRHDIPANQIHGTLLQIRKLISALISSPKSVDLVKNLAPIVQCLATESNFGTRKTPCLVIRATYINIVLDIAICCLSKLEEEDGPVFLELSNTIRDMLEILLQENLSYQLSPDPSLPGHSMLDESTGKLFAFCWIWQTSTESVFYPLRCEKQDVTCAFLKTLKKHFKNKEKCEALKNTERSSQLEDALIELASTSLNRRSITKVFALLRLFVSFSESVKVLDLARQQVTETFWQDDKLVGAIVSCQAVCFKKIMSAEESAVSNSKLLERLHAWLGLLENACSVLRHRVCVRLCVSDSLRTLAIELLVDAKQRYRNLCAQAWKILFLLLVDEDEIVRKTSAQIVCDIAKACDVTTADELPVDILSIETALSSLLACQRGNSNTVQAIFNFLSNLTGVENAEEPLNGAPEQSLFDRGATNVFVEPAILKRLVQRFRVQNHNVSS